MTGITIVARGKRRMPRRRRGLPQRAIRDRLSFNARERLIGREDKLGIEPGTGLLDRTKRALHVDGVPVPLTRREFDVVAYLAARAGEPVARDSLIEDVWGLRFDPGSNVVDAVVASLRRKLGGLSGATETVRGFGYLYRAADTGRPEGV